MRYQKQRRVSFVLLSKATVVSSLWEPMGVYYDVVMSLMEGTVWSWSFLVVFRAFLCGCAVVVVVASLIGERVTIRQVSEVIAYNKK
jgi:hypothetical protein